MARGWYTGGTSAPAEVPMRRPTLALLVLSALAACSKGGGDTVDTTHEDTGYDGPCTDADGDGYCAETKDCDDTNKLVHQDATEVPYNGRDDDCDGKDLTDIDGDGHDSTAVGGDDCNDGNPEVYPGTTVDECDPTNTQGIDYNCDGVVILDDCDGDGYQRADDCDDKDASSYPGAPDPWYDGVDEDCQRNSDYDADEDGDDASAYGGKDCDDTDATVGPKATELWDGKDENCVPGDDLEGTKDAWKTYNGALGDSTWTTTVTVMDDIDGDGYDDIFAADLGKALGGKDFYGGGYILSLGQPDGLASAVAFQTFTGSAETELFGWSSDDAHDLDGDGLDELIVGAPEYGADQLGAGLVFLGTDMKRGGSVVSDFAWATLWGDPNVNTGLTVAAVGDLNGDGISELEVGTDDIEGLSYTFYDGAKVAKGGELSFDNDRLTWIADYYATGGAVIAAGDIDGDGMNEVLFGRTTPDYICGGACDGTSRLYVASADELTASTSADMYSMDYIKGETGLGQTATILNDVNGDGYKEVAAADPFTNGLDGTQYGGTVYVIDGDDIVDTKLASTEAMFTVTADTGNMFMRVGRNAGDYDGDGVDDLMVGTPGNLNIYDTFTGTFPTVGYGNVYHYDSSKIVSGGTYVLADADASFRSELYSSTFGMSWDVGDFDADGKDDVAIGGPLYGYGKLFVYQSQL